MDVDVHVDVHVRMDFDFLSFLELSPHLTIGPLLWKIEYISSLFTHTSITFSMLTSSRGRFPPQTRAHPERIPFNRSPRSDTDVSTSRIPQPSLSLSLSRHEHDFTCFRLVCSPPPLIRPSTIAHLHPPATNPDPAPALCLTPSVRT